MKKILFLAASVMLLAAACNSQQASNQTGNPTTTTQTKQTSSTRVDAAVSGLYSSVDSEQTVTTQSDDSVINSDKSLINTYDGVSNANY